MTWSARGRDSQFANSPDGRRTMWMVSGSPSCQHSVREP